MTQADLDAIEARVQKCLEAVNQENQPMGRLTAWGLHGAGIIRSDVPALIAALRTISADIEAEGK